MAFSEVYRSRGKYKMAELCKTVVKSFSSANDRELRSRNLKVSKVIKTEKHLNRIVPTKKDVYNLVDHAANKL